MVFTHGGGKPTLAVVVTYAWTLWRNRNEVHLGGQRKSGKALFQWATQYLEEFHAATDSGPYISSSVSLEVAWTPPPQYPIYVQGKC